MPESSSSSTSSCSSCSSAAPPVVDLDIEGVAEEKEGEVGGLVVRRHDNNEAHRKEIDLITTAVAGNVTLDVTVTTPSGPNVVPAEIKVFDAREDGNEIEFDGTKNKFPVGELPKLLYVQGHQGSNTMRDVTLKLTHDQTGSFASVNFTVLWVKMTSNHSDDVSVGNSRRELYREMGVPQVGYALGEGRLIATVGVPSLAEEQVGLSAYSEGMTRGSELVGTLSPSDFKPSEFGGRMTMLRAYLYAWVYKGASGHEQILGFDGAWDNSPDVMRDDDPQSRPDPESTAAPPGTIYDFDTPGVPAIGMPNGFDPIATDDIIRFRVNFHEFAAYIAPGRDGGTLFLVPPMAHKAVVQA